ncbi:MULTISPECIES: hypothetical protein [Rhodomicrobium]|uniref:hypothetical protein n=1 Tax=Rhodomicrobium TaxID=1068 RepID=UPI000F73968E|nr:MULTISPECIES: hypothetical protein [Rhodomicrobium]
MRSRLWFPMLCVWLLALAAGAAQAAERPANEAPLGGVSFRTLDGDVQEVEISEIWRIRDTAGRDEPPGAVVIDYAFERLYVKDTLDNVVAKVRVRRKVDRFTLPSGKPVYVVADKVIGIMRAIPGQHHERSKSLLMAREGQQQVQESREAIRELLHK